MDPETELCLDVLLVKCSGAITQTRMASALGIDKATVSRRAAKLRSGTVPVFVSRPYGQGGGGSSDRLAVLEESRSLLIETLRESTGTARANVSKELRAVMDEIDALGVDDGPDPLDELIASRGR